METASPGDRIPQRRCHVSSREALLEVRRAFTACDDVGLQMAYASARRRTRGLRCALSFVDRVFPITQVVEFAGEMNARIREDGLAEACRVGIHRLGLECEFSTPEAARDVLAGSPVVVYGNHPTVLTPFLVAAAAGRSDMRLFMVDYVRRLMPALGDYLLPVEVPREPVRVGWHRGRAIRLLSQRLAHKVVESRDRTDAKRLNQESLLQGARHILQGGCAVIFPGGGGRDERQWYPGIGQLAENLRTSASASDVFFLAVHEDAPSEAHVYRGLRRLDKWGDESSRETVRVRFGEPRRLVDLVAQNANREEITRALQAVYQATFALGSLLK